MDNSFQNSYPVDNTDKISPPAKKRKNASVINVGQFLLLIFLLIVICLQAVHLLVAPSQNIITEPITGGDISNEFSDASENANNSGEAAAESDIIFILGENNGKLAILSPDRQVIYETLDVYINTLPEFDRNLLLDGIKIRTSDELSSLLEDFSS